MGRGYIPRSSAMRDRARAYWKRQAPLRCALCNLPIDLDLKYPDRDSLAVDHILPLEKGGADEISNTQPTHLGCNDKKRAKVQHTVIKRSGALKLPD